jgi:hypothetical protein
MLSSGFLFCLSRISAIHLAKLHERKWFFVSIVDSIYKYLWRAYEPQEFKDIWSFSWRNA